MLKLIARRLLLAVGVVWLVATVVFLATQALPGDAARAILGREAATDALEVLQKQLGTDQPIPQQYVDWLGRMVRFDLGTSLANGMPVGEFIAPLIRNSLVLVIIAATASTLVALVFGIWTAARRDSALDHATTVVTLITAAVPEFVVGIALVWWFAVGAFQWLPAVFSGDPGQPAWTNPLELVLPAATLVIAVAPYLTRMLRATMLEALETEYVQHARLKGLPERVVLLRHAMPNALGPVIQVLALQFAWLAGGVVIVEYLFAYPGIGTAVISAVQSRDIPVAQALTVFLAVFYVFVNLVADVLTLILNPRARTAQ